MTTLHAPDMSIDEARWLHSKLSALPLVLRIVHICDEDGLRRRVVAGSVKKTGRQFRFQTSADAAKIFPEVF